MFDSFFVIRQSRPSPYEDEVTPSRLTELRIRCVCREDDDLSRLPSNVAYLVLAYCDSQDRKVFFFRTLKRAQPVKVVVDGSSITAELSSSEMLKNAIRFADALDLPFLSDSVEKALLLYPYLDAIMVVLGARVFDFGLLKFENTFESSFSQLEDGDMIPVGICRRDNRFLVLARTSFRKHRSRRRSAKR
jgi:hypothetical protein